MLGRGLGPGATIAIAERLTDLGTGVAVPADALPAGLHARPELDLARWESGWTTEARASISFQDNEHQAWLSLTSAPADDDWRAGTAFFLSDVRHLVVGNGTGVAGTYRSRFDGRPSAVAIWERGGRRYAAFGSGIGVDEVIGYVGSVVQPGDTDWRASRWDDLREAAAECCATEYVFGNGIAVATATTGDDVWSAELEFGPTARWALTNHDADTSATFGVGELAEPPGLTVSTFADWWSTDQTFQVAAMAMVDRGSPGARLALSTTGSDPQRLDVELAPVTDTPYLAAAAVLPWTDGGFVAELIGPDGRPIARSTDAEVP